VDEPRVGLGGKRQQAMGAMGLILTNPYPLITSAKA
jgi:hypothetical protein